MSNDPYSEVPLEDVQECSECGCCGGSDCEFSDDKATICNECKIKKAIKEGIITKEELEKIREDFRKRLQNYIHISPFSRDKLRQGGE